MRIAFCLALGLLGAGCASAPPPVSIAAPETLSARLERSVELESSWLIEFEWRYRGREGRFAGEGGIRVNPPESIRLDLFGPGWSGVQSAVLIGDRVRYIGEQRIELPPPTFLWAMFGIFRPPWGTEPEAFRRGDHAFVAYPLTPEHRVIFEFDPEGRLVGAEMREGGHAVQRIRLTRSDSAAGPAARWPEEAVFRDLREFHEVRVDVTAAREHELFEEDIFTVVAR